MKAGYVYDINEIPEEEDCRVGIVVSLNRRASLSHCGVAYNVHNDLRILHLATHKDIRVDDEWGYFLVWVKPTFPAALQDALIPFFEVIEKKINAGDYHIPYGFKYENYSTFDGNGDLILGKGSKGLSCSTYVITLFHSIGIDLVDIKNWPSREEDLPWYAFIINIFERNGMSNNLIANLKQEIGVPRFRPEETAVSSALRQGTPAHYTEIWAHGKELLDYLYQIAR